MLCSTLAQELGLPLDTELEELRRIREARYYGMPDSAEKKFIVIERERRTILTILPELSKDASWQEIYEALKKSEIPEIRACLAAAEWWLKKTKLNYLLFHKDIDSAFQLDKEDYVYSDQDIIFMSYVVYNTARCLLHFRDFYPTAFWLCTYNRPDLFLSDAGDLVGFCEFDFPSDSSTKISKDSVIAEDQEIYSAPVDKDHVSPDIFEGIRTPLEEICGNDDQYDLEDEQGKVLRIGRR